MDIIIVSGLSGSGKSNAVNVLEDIGYYCIDNIPASLISQFAELCARNEKPESVAMVVDARSGDFLGDIEEAFRALDASSLTYRILFFEASDETLKRRFKETRRNHPLSRNGITLADAIADERKMLLPLRSRADFIVDTSQLTVKQLRGRITELFLGDSKGSMKIHFMSFGFKYGMPSDADLMIDVRCLPNPFYEESLRSLTGKDKAIQDYVLEKDDTKGFIEKFTALLDYLIPLYVKEGKASLTVAVGCTGGKHRSVTLADYFADYVTKNHSPASSDHRDINKL